PGPKLPPIADRNLSISRDHVVLIGARPQRGSIGCITADRAFRHITINDLPVGRSVEETTRLVKAFRSTDEHGEVCPTNCSEGAKTKKADPTGSLECFATAENGNGSKKRT
ncbi:uncharacterized protein BXZ73DRAFT_5154, partial [Epithele typhae]|uniref:uncharacterized protein n=1 Tax=Epithele typhae TaxID=378194 RepID=UPI0020080D99